MPPTETAATERLPRIAFVTIGQAPRPDVVPEIVRMLDGASLHDEFGALDGLGEEDLGRHAASADDDTLYTRLVGGRHVALRAGFVEERLQALMRRVDRRGYDLIVLITTGVFQPMTLRTPFVHGQRALEAWISTLVLGNCQLGVIYPLARQTRSAPLYGTLIQNARSAAAAGGTRSLEVAAKRLGTTDLILMLSVGHTEEMARRVSLIAQKPVVTTRRIIGGLMRLHLGAFAGGQGALEQPSSGTELIGRLPPPAQRLTRREEEVLAHVLDGRSNKMIGRVLGISHRTVEIHRSRVMAKFGTSSATDLIRWALRSRSG
ncbi:MAG: AroM family protein [Hyphomicrobiales bacterium]